MNALTETRKHAMINGLPLNDNDDVDSLNYATMAKCIALPIAMHNIHITISVLQWESVSMERYVE